MSSLNLLLLVKDIVFFFRSKNMSEPQQGISDSDIYEEGGDLLFGAITLPWVSF